MVEPVRVVRPLLRFVQISHQNIQAHRTIAHRRRVEDSRFDFQAGVETRRPFNDVTLPSGFGFGGAFLRARENPLLILPPGVLTAARFAFQETSGADAALARLGQVADHLPGRAVAGGILVAGPVVGGVDQHFDFVAEPGKAFARQFVRLGIVGGQPARCIDPVQHVVGDVEGEIQALAVVLDVALE